MSIEHLLALHSLFALSNRKLVALMAYFGHSATAWENPLEWASVLALPKPALQSLLTERKLISSQQVYESYLLSKAKMVTMADADYPELLKDIANPPYLLFYKGSLPKISHITIALVGSRKATSYGKEVAEILGKELGQAGAWVISGLARGIDSAGHKGAIAGGGKTVGVLGCGIDMIYPKENAALFKAVEENGCIVSEFPIGMEPLAQNFPIRNRIISGLSNGVVVVEAATRSGTQITVDFALEQGREIFAVPGPIFSPLSQGTHKMIREDGIKLVTSAKDILEGFGQLALDFNLPKIGRAFKKTSNLSKQEQQILDFLITPKHFNQILAELNMEPSQLSPILTVCELRSYITRLDGQYYVKINS